MGSLGVLEVCMTQHNCRIHLTDLFLRLNVKMGGVNTVPDARSVPFLSDQNNPTIVMGTPFTVLCRKEQLELGPGADVVHPAPGSEGRPSFTSLVGNVDAATSKYIATTRVQTSRQEMIDDLDDMCQVVLLCLTYNCTETFLGSIFYECTRNTGRTLRKSPPLGQKGLYFIEVALIIYSSQMIDA
jgi:hypothetical protein